MVTQMQSFKRKRLHADLISIATDLDIALGYVACNHQHPDENVHQRADLTLESLRSALSKLELLIVRQLNKK